MLNSAHGSWHAILRTPSPRPTTASPGLRDLVDQRIHALLDRLADDWVARQPQLGDLFATLGEFVAAGGKRLRPLFCIWGAVGAGADEGADDVLDVAAGLELLHAFALIHDDVMDGSDTRRGQPSMHRRFQRRHTVAGLSRRGAALRRGSRRAGR